MVEPLWKFGEEIIHDLDLVGAQQGFQINFVMHGAGMLERILLRQPLTVSEIDLAAMENPLRPITCACQSFSRLMNIEVPKTEEYYLLELIKTITKRNVFLNLQIIDTLKKIQYF